MGEKVQTYDGPCRGCGFPIGCHHEPGCIYGGEGRVGISGNTALREVSQDNSLRQTTRPSRERTIDDKIERLRVRVRRIKAYGGDSDITGVLLGVLDLLGDEL